MFSRKGFRMEILCFLADSNLFFHVSSYFKTLLISFSPTLFILSFTVVLMFSFISFLFLYNFRSLRSVLPQQPLLYFDFCILFSFNMCLYFICSYWSFGLALNKKTQGSQHHARLSISFQLLSSVRSIKNKLKSSIIFQNLV